MKKIFSDKKRIIIQTEKVQMIISFRNFYDVAGENLLYLVIQQFRSFLWKVEKQQFFDFLSKPSILVPAKIVEIKNIFDFEISHYTCEKCNGVGFIDSLSQIIPERKEDVELENIQFKNNVLNFYYLHVPMLDMKKKYKEEDENLRIYSRRCFYPNFHRIRFPLLSEKIILYPNQLRYNASVDLACKKCYGTGLNVLEMLINEEKFKNDFEQTIFHAQLNNLQELKQFISI